MGFPEVGSRVDPKIDQLGVLSFGPLWRNSLSRVSDTQPGTKRRDTEHLSMLLA